MHTIAIFASGAGSNAFQIINRFKNHPAVRVGLIISNNPAAGVLQIAAQEHIPSMALDRQKFFDTSSYVEELMTCGIAFIVLAGFLWKVPVAIIRAYPDKIINIHPALLPAYGGKGMYGSRVHKAVINACETESGITIHYVDELYDHGKIILQQKCSIEENDTPDTLAHKIHQLEHLHYPVVIEALVNPTGFRQFVK